MKAEFDRREPGERRNLEKRVTELTVGVVGMTGAMQALSRALQTELDDLKQANEKQRRLAKYARRTWFEMMAYIFVVGLLVSDVGRRYCGADGNQVGDVQGATCNVVFWTTEHGGGVGWRIAGLLIQAGVLIWMARRAQVPEDLFKETPASMSKRWWRRS